MNEFFGEHIREDHSHRASVIRKEDCVKPSSDYGKPKGSDRSTNESECKHLLYKLYNIQPLFYTSFWVLKMYGGLQVPDEMR